MPQIILAIVLIYLYYLLIKWLFVSVGPGFIYFTALLFSVSVPVVYVRTLVRTFGRQSGSPYSPHNWLFIFVVALVALIHLDLLWLALGIGMSYLQVSFAWDLRELFGRVVTGLAVNREVLGVGNAILPREVGILGQVLFSAAVKSALVVPCVLLVRGFSSEIEDPRQPARLSYFHGQAFKDLGAVIQAMAEDMYKFLLLANNGIVKVTIIGSIFVWPLTIMAYIALLPPIVIAAVAALLLVTMHSLALAAIWALAMGVSLVLSLAERAVILSRTGYAKCPHAECHEPVPLPVFMCPACGEEHDRLVPGRFGVFVRTCACGKGRMPTLFWLGKGRLRSICPSCRKPMREELYGGSVHVPIYGGPSTGKTMFMMAASWELLEGKMRGMRARLIDEASARAYSRHWKPDFESGRVREKTARPFPDAFLLSMRRSVGLPTSVYLYDPAGEALLNESDLDGHRFMKYFDGLALLIDPLSLPSFAAQYSDRGGPDLAPTTSHIHPEETVTRIVNLLERLGELSRRRGFSRRIAVVFTKADVPGFAQEFGISLSGNVGETGDWGHLGADNASQIRNWLRRNEPHLLQILETRFSEIRFFAVSALGHIPQSGMGFSPRKVMEPLAWLLSTRTTFSHPLFSRIIGRTMEIAAVVGVIGALVGLPTWALYWWALR